MKHVLIFIAAGLIVFGCAKKMVPATSGAAPATEITKMPDEVKVAATDPANNPASVAGAKTYEAKCGRCHGLKDPAQWTAEEWVPIMKSMAPKARLDSTERANVTIYVQTHAKAA